MTRYATIVATGRYVPEIEVTNDMLRERFKHIPDFVDKMEASSGIKTRWHAPETWATSDVALPAAKLALERAGKKPEEVDLIILGTDSPDYITPATSVVPALRFPRAFPPPRESSPPIQGSRRYSLSASISCTNSRPLPIPWSSSMAMARVRLCSNPQLRRALSLPLFAPTAPITTIGESIPEALSSRRPKSRLRRGAPRARSRTAILRS